MPSVLFVCTANICRSPMAAQLFQHIASDVDNLATWKVESAGTWAIDGLHSAENAQIVLESMGLDLEEHISQNVSNVDLNDFDLILTMERGHKEALLAEFPEFSDRIFMLSEMIDSTFDVADPIGGGISDYNKTARFLDDLMRRGFPKIKALSSKSG